MEKGLLLVLVTEVPKKKQRAKCEKVNVGKGQKLFTLKKVWLRITHII